jgi:LysR family nitrogen assimilation transcriptional regulator
MDIIQLRSFVMVAEIGSYVKAADILNISQPTLSRQVRMLELELRASLFYRHGRGVHLTERGKKFIEYARSVIHMMDEAIVSIRNTDAVYTGQLIVGLTPTIGRITIPNLAPILKEKFPLASIWLTEGLSGALHEKVLLGQVDLAVVYSPASSPHLTIEPLATEQLYLVGAEPAGDGGLEIPLQDVACLPLILPHSNQWTRPAVETAAARLGLHLNIELEIDSTISAAEIVAHGGGYLIMQGGVQKLKTFPKLSWQKISNPCLESTISLITSVKQPRSQLSQAAEVVIKETILESYSHI